jgi:hypothetical protein
MSRFGVFKWSTISSRGVAVAFLFRIKNNIIDITKCICERRVRNILRHIGIIVLSNIKSLWTSAGLANLFIFWDLVLISYIISRKHNFQITTIKAVAMKWQWMVVWMRLIYFSNSNLKFDSSFYFLFYKLVLYDC